ncbi:uncharacterized protein LOC112127739 isoform X1 [Cimex lectularius]|uniref:Uncharacterized protein n=2 Tax=Cimex lectularius TaxID=79782 RepID=A0A8I6SPN6_CIMLE|nr:uncharacterized protein LOC112127739 isoform X1 [Cimex lectularius]
METTLRVENEIPKPNSSGERRSSINAEQNLPGSSDCPPCPPCYQPPPPYIISGGLQQPFVIGPTANQDYYYVARVETPDSVKLSNACSLYGGILCIIFIIVSFMTFFYFVYYDS